MPAGGGFLDVHLAAVGGDDCGRPPVLGRYRSLAKHPFGWEKQFFFFCVFLYLFVSVCVLCFFFRRLVRCFSGTQFLFQKKGMIAVFFLKNRMGLGYWVRTNVGFRLMKLGGHVGTGSLILVTNGKVWSGVA